MKKILYTVLLCLPTAAFAQVGVGTTTPDASAQLDVTSTTKGALFPRLTTTQRNAISSPATGLVVFNITDSLLQVNTGTAAAPVWNSANAGSLSNISLTSNSTPAGKTVGQMIYNTNAASGVPVGPVYWNGTTWVSAAGNNIYNADGALTGNRTVSLGANNLNFSNAGGKIGINNASPAVGLHTNTSLLVSGKGTAHSQGTFIVWDDTHLGGPGTGISGFLNHRGLGAGGFSFRGTADNTNFREYLRINGSGRVAINDSVPDGNSIVRIYDDALAGNSAAANLRLDNSRNNAVMLVTSSSPAAGGFNPIVNAGDSRLIFSTDGVASSTADSGLVIAPHSTTASGLKIMENGTLGINTASPDKSAVLDVNSTTKGILPPRLTTTQRNAIVNPATGLVIFNITDSLLQVNTGTTIVPYWSSANAGSLSNISLTNNATPAGKTAGQMIYNTNAASGVPVGPVYWNGTTWVSAAGNNIYNADGALTADRTVSLGANNLNFSNSGGKIGINNASPAVGLHTNTSLLVSGNGTAHSQGTFIVWDDTHLGGSGTGISGFLNHRGLGAGGFVFSGTDDNNAFKEYMRIEGQKGHVAVNGPADANNMVSIFDNGTGTGVNVLKLRTTRNNSSIAFASSSVATAEYNDLVKLGDARLIFDTDGDATAAADSGFAIAPWSTSPSGAAGLKIMENGNIGVGATHPNTRLEVAGSVAFKSVSLSSTFSGSYTLDNNASYIVNFGAGTIVFPTASASLLDRIYKIKLYNNTAITGSILGTNGAILTNPTLPNGTYEIHCVSSGAASYLWVIM